MSFLSDDLRDVMNRICERGETRFAQYFTNHHYSTWYADKHWKKTGSYLNYDGQLLSYLPTAKKDKTLSPWESPLRVSGRPGRILRKFLADFGVSFTDADIELLVNELFAAHAVESTAITIDIVSGPDIAYAYDDEDGPESCMHNMGYYMDLYTENPQSIRMIVAYHDDRLCGRALLFNTDHGWYRDGVYGEDKYQTAIRAFSDEQGFMQIIPSGSVVRVHPRDYEVYPYLDTFRYYNMFTGELSAYRMDGWTHALGGTDGSASDTNFTTCDQCHENIAMDEAYFTAGGYWCDSCQEDSRCKECGDFYAELDDGLCLCCVGHYECVDCGERQESKLDDDRGVCADCLTFYHCQTCGKWQGDNLSHRDGICPACWRAELAIVPTVGPCAMAAPRPHWSRVDTALRLWYTGITADLERGRIRRRFQTWR